MGQELLVANRMEAGAEFIREFNKFAPISVAFWLQQAETKLIYLYIACDAADGSDGLDVQRELLKRLTAKRSPWLSSFRVNLVGTSDRIAREAIAYRDRFVTSDVIPYEGTSIGGVEIESAYIYPPVAAM